MWGGQWGAPADPSWWVERLAEPRLLVRLPFAALLDDQLPVELLTTLSGGRLRLTSAAARRLLDAAGTRLRTIVIDDDGTVLGVGRATRQTPGWLTDTLAAIHDTCTGPGCERPARRAHTDHATPWTPTRPELPGGTTDLDNLGPLCATTNRTKESSGWHTTQRTGGIRTWTHPRSGLTTTTIPTTWRPPNDPRHHPRPPTRPTPPGPHPGPPHPAQTHHPSHPRSPLNDTTGDHTHDTTGDADLPFWRGARPPRVAREDPGGRR